MHHLKRILIRVVPSRPLHKLSCREGVMRPLDEVLK
jgi:hypothetical protein